MIEIVNQDGQSLGVYTDNDIIQRELDKGNIQVPICNKVFIRKKWDFYNKIWTEGATEDEISQYSRFLLPKIVSQRQLRTQLVLNGFNLDSIQVAINELEDPHKSIAQIAWDYAITFERDSPLLMCLASNLGLTVDEVDAIFLNASKL